MITNKNDMQPVAQSEIRYDCKKGHSTGKNKKRLKWFKSRWLIFFAMTAFVSIHTPSWSSEYYVSKTTGNDTSAGTINNPWKTLNRANSLLKAGDTVFIREGTYSGEQIAPANSGTSANRIVYARFENESVIIVQSDTPVNLSSRSYITIRGITIKECDKYLTMTSGNHNYIEYCTFSSMRNYERFRGFHIGKNSSYNRIQHCVISGYGEYSDTRDRGDMIYIGDIPDPGTNSRNLIENNHFYHGGHNVFTLNTPYNVIRNNYLHNEEWSRGYGSRITEVYGKGNGKWNLIENNRWCFTGLPPDNNYAPAVKIVSTDNIVRNNMFYQNKGPGIQIVFNSNDGPGGANNNYIYNNVFYHNGINVPSNRAYGILFKGVSGPITGNIIKNNIFFQNLTSSIAYEGSGKIGDNTIVNNWDTNNDPLFVDANISKLDPMNPNYPDFNLQPDSQCINKAVFLTATAKAGSGTQITVTDAHYFMDGWGIIEGDFIQLEGQTKTAKITGINYNTNIITVNTSLTWNSGQGLSLAYQGSAPDMGAFEYGLESPPDPSPDPDPKPEGDTIVCCLYLEAEDMTLISPMVKGNDTNASGGGYIETAQGENSTSPVPEATYQFTLPKSGTYYLWISINGLRGTNHALYVGIDSTWDRVYPVNNGVYEWVKVEIAHGSANYGFNLSSGSHTLRIGHGEINAKADALYLSNDPDKLPAKLASPTFEPK